MESRSLMSAALLVLRLVLGGIMLAHGLQKIGVLGGGAPNLAATIENFGSMGFPSWLGYLAVAAELLGGLGLLVGLLGRLAAFGIAVNMTVAMVKVHWPMFWNQDRGIEFPLALLGMAVALMIAGMGAYSVDAALARRMDKSIEGPSPPQAPPPA